MRLRNAAVSLVGAVVLIGAGTASSGSKSVTLRPTATLRTAKIALLAADGARAAVAPAKRRPCASIVVWDASKNRTSGFHLRTNGCAGDGVRALALSDDQVAWIEHGGGNDLELTLFAARLRGARAIQLDFRVNGDRAGGDPSGGWIGNLVGSGSVLAYNGWRLVCDRADPFSCGRHDPQLRLIDQRLVRIVSGHAATIASGPDTYSLAAAGGGLVAVEHADSVATFTAGGARAAVVPDSTGTLRSVGLSASRLVLERASSLDLYDPRTGAAVKSIAFASDSVHELISVTQRFALLRTPRTFVLVRLADGARAPLAFPPVAQRGLVGVRLTAAGLFYAYNVRNASVPGRVAFVPTRSLAAAF